MVARKVEGVRASAVLRERLRRVAAILAQPEAQAWRVSWDEAAFAARAKIIRPLGDAVREAIFGRPKTGTTEAIVGVADELREVLRILGVHEIPRPVTHGAHSRHAEFVGTDLGVVWLTECATWCARCRGAALNEIRAVLGEVEAADLSEFTIDMQGACEILDLDPEKGGKQKLKRLRDRSENPLPSREDEHGRHRYREADLRALVEQEARARRAADKGQRDREDLEHLTKFRAANLPSPRTGKIGKRG